MLNMGKKGLLQMDMLLLAMLACRTVSSMAAANATDYPAPTPPGAKSVLWFIVDDLRPVSGAYGQDAVFTPNLDRLEMSATTFDFAYCQVRSVRRSRRLWLLLLTHASQRSTD